MSESVAMSFENEEMSLTDRDLVSLYLRYPDMDRSDYLEEGDGEALSLPITTSSTDSSPQSANPHSSPVPNATRYESPASSPLAPSDIVPFPALTIAANDEEIEELTAHFDLSLDSAKLSDKTTQSLAEMKSAIVAMGSILFTTTGQMTTESTLIWRVRSSADWMIAALRRAGKSARKEIKAAESILQLAPFTVRPALEDVWTNYKQMAELIVQRTKTPSAPLLDLYIQLCLIYDTCVYRPVLNLPRIIKAASPTNNTNNSEDERIIIESLLDTLYDALMTLTTRQKQWTAAMKRIGNDFTRPTMRIILRSPQVMQTILQFEGDLKAAATSTDEMESEAKKVLLGLNESSRKRQPHQQLQQQQGSQCERLGLHRGCASIS